MKLLHHAFQNVQNYIESKIGETGAQYRAYGIFGIFNFPIYYIVWLYFSQQTYENLTLRIICTALCFFLVIHDKWPSSLKKFLPVYWHFTLLFTLPFFFTFMLIMNHGSSMWVTNTIVIVFFALLLVEWFSAVIILLIGSMLGALAASFFAKSFFPPTFDYAGFFITYLVAIIIGTIFARNKERVQYAKLQVARSVSTTVAHELRTPLAALQNSIRGLERYYPILLDGYIKAKGSNLPVEYIRSAHIDIMKNLFNDAYIEVRYSNMVIDTLLKNVGQQANYRASGEKYSMRACIEQSLQRYPFSNAKQRSIVKCKLEDDFDFYGDEILMTNLLFNLLKNALYFVNKAGKGEICILLKSGDKLNRLHFKDTGTGIDDNVYKKLFTRFHTTERHGSGLGLAFCKMVMEGFGGDITCKTKFGEYTEFILSFPLVK